MKTLLAFILVLAACGGGNGPSSPPDLAMSTSPGPGPDLATSSDLSQSSAQDLATTPTADMACGAVTGATCPSTAGNCQGIGTPCTKGGGQCAPSGTNCDLDLDPSGSGTCVSYGKCTPGMHQCGGGATCCKSSTTFFIAVCIANVCLPDDCPAE